MSLLEVDGSRPVVTWVSGLPRTWTTTRERLVLFCLAADTYDREPPFECSPTLDQVASWCGEHKGRVVEAINSLCSPTRDRPALLEKTAGSGRSRSSYRLCIEASWSALPDHNVQSAPADHYEHTEDPDGGRSGPRSGPASGPRSSPPQRTTPFPDPTQPQSPVPETSTKRAREALQNARWETR